MATYIANATVAEFNYGEIVDIEPVMWADYIEAGILSEIDANGHRVGTFPVYIDLP